VASHGSCHVGIPSDFNQYHSRNGESHGDPTFPKEVLKPWLHEAEQFLKKWYSEPVFDEHADHTLQRPCHTTILMVAIRPVVVLIISDYHHSDHLDQKTSAS
jgi:hypothetical protein